MHKIPKRFYIHFEVSGLYSHAVLVSVHIHVHVRVHAVLGMGVVWNVLLNLLQCKYCNY